MTSFQLVILVCTKPVRQETPFLPSCHLKQPFSLVTQCTASPMICYFHSMNLTGFPAFSTGVQADPTSFPLVQKILTELTACLFPQAQFFNSIGRCCFSRSISIRSKPSNFSQTSTSSVSPGKYF